MVPQLEVEGKYPVECSRLEELHSRLVSLGGEEAERRVEEDLYMAHPCRDFMATDEALRLRYVDGRLESITYKGPRLPGRVKSRVELILRAEGPVEEVLERLGFRPALKIVKSRVYMRLGDATVTLDRVEGLGCYVEVEAPRAEEVERVASVLGLEGPPIFESYVELLLKRGGGSPSP